MKRVKSLLENKQKEFQAHPFFKLIKELNAPEQSSYFVPQLTFWAMTFQDILRLNEERIQEPLLQQIAKQHRKEDRGHEKWFLKDKYYLASKFNNLVPSYFDTQWLFGVECQSVRDAAYALVSEVFRADDEHINIAVVLMLESTGHVFFEEIADFFKRIGENDNLKYFSSFHLDVEKAHEMFASNIEEKLYAIELSNENLGLIIEMIERGYATFNQMFDALCFQVKEKMPKEEIQNLVFLNREHANQELGNAALV